MGYGIAGQSAPGNLNQPSPSIFGDSPNGEVTDEGQGYYIDKDFMCPVTLPDMLNAPAGATATYAYDTTYDSTVSGTTGAAGADGLMLFTRPFASLALGSGKQAWAEVELAFGNVTAVQGFFFGFLASSITTGTTGFPVPTVTGVKASYVTNVSTTRATNTITTMSAVGFLGVDTSPQVAGNLALDAFYINQPTYSASATALPTVPAYPTTPATLAAFNYSAQPTTVGSVVLIQADITNSPSITANFPANQSNASNAPISQAVTTTIGGFPGNLQAYTATQSTTNAAFNNGFVKLGLRYDGQQSIYWYVNGVRAARATVNGTYDQASNYGIAISWTGNAIVNHVKRFRAGSNLLGNFAL